MAAFNFGPGPGVGTAGGERANLSTPQGRLLFLTRLRPRDRAAYLRRIGFKVWAGAGQRLAAATEYFARTGQMGDTWAFRPSTSIPASALAGAGPGPGAGRPGGGGSGRTFSIEGQGGPSAAPPSVPYPNVGSSVPSFSIPSVGITMPKIGKLGLKTMNAQKYADSIAASFDAAIDSIAQGIAQGKANTAQEIADLDSWFSQIGKEQQKSLLANVAAGKAAVEGHAGVVEGLVQAAGGNETAAGLAIAGGARDDTQLRSQAAATESLDNQLMGLVAAEGALSKRDRQNLGAQLASELALEMAKAESGKVSARAQALFEALQYNNEVRMKRADWKLGIANMNLGVQQTNAGFAMQSAGMANDAAAAASAAYRDDRATSIAVQQNEQSRQDNIWSMQQQLAAEQAATSAPVRKPWAQLTYQERGELVANTTIKLTLGGEKFPSGLRTKAQLKQRITNTLVQLAGINNPSAVAQVLADIKNAFPAEYAALA